MIKLLLEVFANHVKNLVLLVNKILISAKPVWMVIITFLLKESVELVNLLALNALKKKTIAQFAFLAIN